MESELFPAAQGDNVDDGETTAFRIEANVGVVVDRRLRLNRPQIVREARHDKSRGEAKRANHANHLGLSNSAGNFATTLRSLPSRRIVNGSQVPGALGRTFSLH